MMGRYSKTSESCVHSILGHQGLTPLFDNPFKVKMVLSSPPQPLCTILPQQIAVCPLKERLRERFTQHTFDVITKTFLRGTWHTLYLRASGASLQHYTKKFMANQFYLVSVTSRV